MEMWIIWLIIMGVLLIVEVLSQMMWALCLALGCVGALVGDLFGASVLWQVIVLAICGVVAYMVLLPVFQKWHAFDVDRKGREARTGMDALLGRRAFVEVEIRPDHLGRGRIDGDNWQMKAVGDSKVIPRGTEVVVTGYESIVLEVRPLH